MWFKVNILLLLLLIAVACVLADNSWRRREARRRRLDHQQRHKDETIQTAETRRPTRRSHRRVRNLKLFSY